MADGYLNQHEYVEKVLLAYRNTPGTAGTIRQPDRQLAVQWYAQGVPLKTVENVFTLAVARRLMHRPELPPLNTIRSLAYFAPVLREILESRISPDYFVYLRDSIARHLMQNPPVR
jgi:hypothetical protein